MDPLFASTFWILKSANRAIFFISGQVLWGRFVFSLSSFAQFSVFWCFFNFCYQYQLLWELEFFQRLFLMVFGRLLQIFWLFQTSSWIHQMLEHVEDADNHLHPAERGLLLLHRARRSSDLFRIFFISYCKLFL